MRFLCLHGSGTRGDIFRLQLASICQVLPEHTFEFINGYVNSDAGPGVGTFFGSPFFAWWNNRKSEQEIKQACSRLLEYMKRRQYDAIICFSQGCAVLSSLIVYHQTDFPDEPLPFRGAVFMSGGIALPVYEGRMPVSEEAKHMAESTFLELKKSGVRTAQRIEEMASGGKRREVWDRPTLLWDGSNAPAWNVWSLPPVDESNVYGLDLSNVPVEGRIKIPTVIIYGHKDPMCPNHVQLAMLCDKDQRQVYNHCGGHEVPRSRKVTNDIASAIQWLVDRIEET